MKLRILTSICFLMAFLPSLLHAQLDANTKLRLQLGAYRNMAMGKFDQIKLNEIKGAIYTEDIGNGVKRVFVGDYSSPETAEKALEKLKALGYENAYIVAVDATKDTAVKQANNEAIKTVEPVAAPQKVAETKAQAKPAAPTKVAEKANYVIQLGSFSQVNFKSFGNVADLGELTAERVGDATKMTLGTYTSRTDADRILAVVKQRGYPVAFIKTITIAEK